MKIKKVNSELKRLIDSCSSYFNQKIIRHARLRRRYLIKRCSVLSFHSDTFACDVEYFVLVDRGDLGSSGGGRRQVIAERGVEREREKGRNNSE